MKKVKSFDDFIGESVNEGELTIVPVGLRGTTFYVRVNGNEYGYGSKGEGLTIKEIADKFGKLLKYSTGRALAWLKKNTELVSGSTKNESHDYESIGYDFVMLESLAEGKKTDKEEVNDKKDAEAKEKEEAEAKTKEDDENPKDEEVAEFNMDSAIDFVKEYIKDNKYRFVEKEKEKFQKLEAYLKENKRKRIAGLNK